MIFAQEPSCHTSNRFEYEFQVLQKLDSLEKGTATLREKHAALLVQVEAIGFENKGMHTHMTCFITIKHNVISKINKYVMIILKKKQLSNIQIHVDILFFSNRR